MKKVVLAPDSFKGSLSSREVCDIVSSAILSNYPDAQIKCIPVADGGEGTAEAFIYSSGGERVYCKVKSPLGRDVKAYYAMLADKTAVVECALASGLTVEQEREPLLASSYGTGQLIRAALDGGAERIFVGIGGSAMTDGGTGCLGALGARFYDGEGRELYPCGKNLEAIRKIDISGLDKRIYEKPISVLCDVKNPLYGKNGAAYIFAPQKGAEEKETELLDRGLENFAAVSAAVLGKDYSFCEGAGAAGGLGFALVAFMGAELKSGIDIVLDYCGFEKAAEGADLIITGEGKLDSQSLMGKVPFGVASRASGKRMLALVGINEASADECAAMGISEVLQTNPMHLPFEEIKHRAKEILYAAAEKIIL
ncbi:MAG: glycerate kinase [Ruminococcaceae bacterium]|nr:glycerate kinase [Oscillospiraceae bacterium]